jgi:hypothetical protein
MKKAGQVVVFRFPQTDLEGRVDSPAKEKTSEDSPDLRGLRSYPLK